MLTPLLADLCGVTTMANDRLIETFLDECRAFTQLQWSRPPGMLGTIAEYIWDQSLYPTPEVSIASAVFILASQLGRSYNVETMGLNLFIHLIAPTASGKNFAGDGISNIYKLVQSRLTQAHHKIRIGPGRIPSGEGLVRHIVGSEQDSIKACLCSGSYLGESGYFWKRLFSGKDDSNAGGILAILLQLATESGAYRTIDPTSYSKIKDRIAAAIAPCYSLLSDSTDDVFYKVITREAIASGFYPRSLVFEFKGSTLENPSFHRALPSDELINWFAGEIKAAIDYEIGFDQSSPAHLQWRDIPFDQTAGVQYTELRRNIREAFLNLADERGVLTELFSRVPQKVAKVAAIAAIATARPGVDPVIGMVEYSWAREFVLRGTWSMVNKHLSGELGPQSDTSECSTALETELKRYVQIVRNEGFTPKVMKQLRIPSTMVAALMIDAPGCGIVITANYLQQQLHKRPCFANNRAGSKSLPNTIQEFIEAGKLEELPALPTKFTSPDDPRYQWIKRLRGD
jgi:hypothetical protein